MVIDNVSGLASRLGKLCQEPDTLEWVKGTVDSTSRSIYAILWKACIGRLPIDSCLVRSNFFRG